MNMESNEINTADLQAASLTYDRLKYADQIEEFDSLMQAGLDEIAVDDTENAEEYFSDAACVLNQINNKQLQQELQNKYTINPLDFAC